MSIKHRLEIELQNARSALPDEHVLKLDKAWTLAALLQEPQPPRRAPDYPEPGQVFWQMVYGEPRLCAVHSCCLWVTLNLSPGKTGRYAEGERIEIKEWIPYTPPQFTEQGS